MDSGEATSRATKRHSSGNFVSPRSRSPPRLDRQKFYPGARGIVTARSDTWWCARPKEQHPVAIFGEEDGVDEFRLAAGKLSDKCDVQAVFAEALKSWADNRRSLWASDSSFSDNHS